MKPIYIVAIVFICVTGVIVAGYLIGVAANTAAVRSYNLQRECQSAGAYWDSYRGVCGSTGGQK